MKIRFTVRRPGGSRRTFAIWKDVKYPSGKRTWTKVLEPSLGALNGDLIKGRITPAEVEQQIMLVIKPRLLKEAGVQDAQNLRESISLQNQRIFREIWKQSYKGGAFLKNSKSTENDLLAAIKSIEPLSLYTASEADLLAALSKETNNRYRRYAIRINELLRFKERGFQLSLKPRVLQVVDYINWEDLQKIKANIYSDEVKLLADVLFCTGVRLGEAFMLNQRSLKSNGAIFVNKQLTHDLQIRDLKNSKPHDTILLPHGKESFNLWCNVNDKKRFRNTASHQIISAARKTFSDKERHISPHDLRHSYAIYWLEMRATVTEVASLLGDTESTVRRHYTGYIVNDRMIDNLRNLLH